MYDSCIRKGSSWKRNVLGAMKIFTPIDLEENFALINALTYQTILIGRMDVRLSVSYVKINFIDQHVHRKGQSFVRKHAHTHL